MDVREQVSTWDHYKETKKVRALSAHSCIPRNLSQVRKAESKQ